MDHINLEYKTNMFSKANYQSPDFNKLRDLQAEQVLEKITILERKKWVHNHEICPTELPILNSFNPGQTMAKCFKCGKLSAILPSRFQVRPGYELKQVWYNGTWMKVQVPVKEKIKREVYDGHWLRFGKSKKLNF